MADILDEKINLSVSQARGPLNFDIVDKHGKRGKDTYSFRVNTIPAFNAGTYTLRDILDRLSKCAHIHSKTIFQGQLPQSNADCNCNCNCDCGDDGG